ncbi:DUF748 domain-containing protein [Flexithrix dorotheae]|uniref:DUF748 domain-containing protein n=1 Tax=Flexithrix dorotheae TaxID=70993 RepID=UPI0003629ED6|nr:DUF748 domain-containing protein [Flexithrix dorotheae]
MKKKSILWALFLALAGIIGFLFWRVDDYISFLVKKTLAENINQDPTGFYDYKIERIETGFLSGNLTVHGLSMEPKAGLIDSMEAKQLKALASVKVEMASLRGLEIRDLIFNNLIEIKKITVSKPEISYFLDPLINSTPNKIVFDQVLSETFQSASIREIGITKGKFSLIDMSQDSLYAITLDSFFLSMKTFQMDSSTLASGDVFDFKYFEVGAQRFTGNILKDHMLTSGQVSFSTNDTTLNIQIETPALTPRLSKTAYNAIIPYEKPWIKAQIDKIQLKEIDMNTWFENGIIKMKNLSILNPEFELYTDKRLPDRPRKSKPLMAEIIRDLPLPISIDTLEVQNANLTVEFFPDNGVDQSATMYFTDLDILGDNLTNAPEYLKTNPVFSTRINGKMMGGNLGVNVKIPVADLQNTFSIAGNLNNMPMEKFNPFMESFALIKISSGEINQLDFLFEADNTESNGTMDFHYQNLKFEVLKLPKKVKNGKTKSGFLSFAVNTATRNKNIPDTKKYRQGIIQMERDHQKSFIAYIVGSVGSGVISSVVPVGKKGNKKGKKKNQ